MTTNNPDSKQEALECPFCHEPDFDLIGLKAHLNRCDALDAIETVYNPMIEPRRASVAAVEGDFTEVAQCAQAVLTALNVGDVQSGSLLHLKLREVMITYRDHAAGGPMLTDERVDAFIREHENDPADGAQLERVRQRFNKKLAAASSPAPADQTEPKENKDA